MTAKIVRVELDDRGYDIHIGAGFLADSLQYIKPALASDRVVIITDENVEEAGHVDTLEMALGVGNIRYDTIVLPAGEATKSFAQLEDVLNKLLALQPDRKMTLIALGGGVVGDLTGFAASILLRGVPFIQVPTTLLAMVDSSVGGKTGINTQFGKNLIGSFYQPKLVLADVSLLATLPKREILAGYAEVVKYGLIENRDFFDALGASFVNAKLLDDANLNSDAFVKETIEVVAKCCQAKAEIVVQDEKEGGVRALLNLGHTFGHALEAEMGYDGRLLHGEAVAVGMVLAFQYSCRLGMCSQEDVKKVEQHLMLAGLPTAIHDISSDLSADVLVKHMYQDKKVESGKLVFILVDAIGKAVIKRDVDGADVLSFLEDVI